MNNMYTRFRTQLYRNKRNKILQLATSLRNQNKTTLKTTRNTHILNADVAQTVCSQTIVMFTLKEKLLDLIEWPFKSVLNYLACNDRKAFFTSSDRIKIKLRSFKSSEHSNEKGFGPYRDFG